MTPRKTSDLMAMLFIWKSTAFLFFNGPILGHLDPSTDALPMNELVSNATHIGDLSGAKGHHRKRILRDQTGQRS
ncbi:MAG: hypothetical protein JW932_06720 [Deltaproteobacteria bacterium]|nr:hypothetical protein [Deltaproteobacteria bacterium]